MMQHLANLTQQCVCTMDGLCFCPDKEKQEREEKKGEQPIMTVPPLSSR